MNYPAILVVAIINMILGFLWYGPLFGRQWMALSGTKMENIDRSAMPRIYGITFVAALVTAFVMSRFVDWAGAATLGAGATVGFWAWLGFVATVAVSSVLYENRPTGLYVLNNGYQLVSLLIMGGILAVWS